MKIVPSERTRGTSARLLSVVVMFSAIVFGLTGCTSLRPSEQRLVAKPNMIFSDSAAWVYNSSRLYPQLAKQTATLPVVDSVPIWRLSSASSSSRALAALPPH